MQLGIIGLGKMGFNMAERLRLGGSHEVDRALTSARRRSSKLTATGSEGRELAGRPGEGDLQAPRAVWIMVPAGDPVDETIAKLEPLMEKGDIVHRRRATRNYKDTPAAACGGGGDKGFNYHRLRARPAACGG